MRIQAVQVGGVFVSNHIQLLDFHHQLGHHVIRLLVAVLVFQVVFQQQNVFVLVAGGAEISKEIGRCIGREKEREKML